MRLRFWKSIGEWWDRRCMGAAKIPTRFQKPHSIDGKPLELDELEDGLPHFVFKESLLLALKKFYGRYIPLEDVTYLRWVADEDDCEGGFLLAHVRIGQSTEVIRFRGGPDGD
jgi:hypothetical protein